MKTNSICHRGVSTKERALLSKHYLCIDVTVSCINLNIVKLTNYQDELHDKIKELYDSGLGYRKIADWLNQNQYKTPRGHEFKNNHVHSILKKRRIRNKSINRPYELTFGDWYVKDISKK